MRSPLSVIIHLGPHKTGTTSIQQVLLDQYGTPAEHAPWYPRLTNQPGHSDLIEDFRGGRGGTALQGLHDTAVSNQCSHLILSSEDFANLPARQFSRALDSLGDTRVLLVFTLSSFLKRVHSLWQERLKHGSTHSLDQSLAWLLDTASLAPDLIGRFARACPKAGIAVAIADSHDPGVLWRNFGTATGIPTTCLSKDMPFLNKSVGPLECELLLTLNRAWESKAHGDPVNRWRALYLMLQMFERPEWRDTTPAVRISIPEEWRRPLRNLAAATLINLIALRNAGRICIAGRLSSLLDFDRNGEFRPVPLPSRKGPALR